jgi:S1-C subfamily serine protease
MMVLLPALSAEFLAPVSNIEKSGSNLWIPSVIMSLERGGISVRNLVPGWSSGWNSDERESVLIQDPITEDVSMLIWRVFGNIMIGIERNGIKIPFIQLEIPYSLVGEVCPLVPLAELEWLLRYLEIKNSTTNLATFLRETLSIEKEKYRAVSVAQSSHIEERQHLLGRVNDAIVKIREIHPQEKNDRGSGVVIKVKENIYILTSAHLLDHDATTPYELRKIIQKNFYEAEVNGRYIPVNVVGYNWEEDVAILSPVLQDNLYPLSVAEKKSFDRKIGIPIFCAGFGGGDNGLLREEMTVFWGWAVTSVGQLGFGRSSKSELISLSVGRLPGMSGGPVVNLKTKEIVGIIFGGASNDTWGPIITSQKIQTMVESFFKETPEHPDKSIISNAA